MTSNVYEVQISPLTVTLFTVTPRLQWHFWHVPNDQVVTKLPPGYSDNLDRVTLFPRPEGVTVSGDLCIIVITVTPKCIINRSYQTLPLLMPWPSYYWSSWGMTNHMFNATSAKVCDTLELMPRVETVEWSGPWPITCFNWTTQYPIK